MVGFYVENALYFLSEYAIIIQKMKGIAQMAVYKSKYRLGNRDVDMHSKLRTSALFNILQEAASQHCIELGFGPAFTEKRNLIWVITRQKAEINRLPVYEEEILLETWPGPTKHVIFPRYYKISDIRGNVLINASSVCTLAAVLLPARSTPEALTESIRMQSSSQETALTT